MLTEGQILEGKYRVGPLLSRGGMGAVYIGENTRIKRKVAIKVLLEEEQGSESSRRFEKEAQAAGQIGSDHIVEVLDLGTTPEGDRFMVMEFLDGETLRARLARGRLQPDEVIALMTQVLEGLTAAHAAGIVHRDLKPDNVFILKGKAGRRDFVKIVDFGISKFKALGAEGGMTKTGAVMGTPFYMSPEQARATTDVDARSDIYAVGVLMYEAVTGTVPFNGTSFTELLFKIVFDEVPHPTTVVPDLDVAFAEIILKAMARDQVDRHQTAAELQDALSQWQQASGARAAPPAAPTKTAAPQPSAPQQPAPQQPAPQLLAPTLAGTAILASGSLPTRIPQAIALPLTLAQSQPGLAPPPVTLAQSQPGLAQSVSSGSQLPGAPPAAPNSRAGVFAVAALLVVTLGGVALFALARSKKDTGQGATPEATAAPSPAVSAIEARPASGGSAIATAQAIATTQPVETPTAAPSSEPAVTAAPVPPQRRAGAWPPAAPKPADTAGAKAPPPKGTLKDLGY